MFECMIIGDSIGVGVKSFMPECVSYSVGGITSWNWNTTYHFVNLTTSKTVIISLGSNDGKPSDQTVNALLGIRHRTDAEKVIWVLPTGAARNSVMYVTNKFGDRTIEIKQTQPDKVHPTGSGYQAIVEEIRK